MSKMNKQLECMLQFKILKVKGFGQQPWVAQILPFGQTNLMKKTQNPKKGWVQSTQQPKIKLFFGYLECQI